MRKILLFTAFLLIAVAAFAQPVRVAVAANAYTAADEIRRNFTKETGIAIDLISGASGKLSAQIENGAPFDIFLSADMEFARQLYSKGLATVQPKVYASGSLIFCSAAPGVNASAWKEMISAAGDKKIALANPATAPYGKAAEEAIGYYRLSGSAKSKLVYGESIAQVNTYITTGSVTGGFTTESLIHEAGAAGGLNWVRIDSKAYQPIRQGAVLLKSIPAAQQQNARRFYNYLFGAEAKKVFRKFGYK